MIDLGTSRLTSSETIGRANLQAGSITLLMKFTQFDNQSLRPTDLDAKILLRGLGGLGYRKRERGVGIVGFCDNWRASWTEGGLERVCSGVRCPGACESSDCEDRKARANRPTMRLFWFPPRRSAPSTLQGPVQEFRQSSPVWSVRDVVETQNSSRSMPEPIAPRFLAEPYRAITKSRSLCGLPSGQAGVGGRIRGILIGGCSRSMPRSGPTFA